MASNKKFKWQCLKNTSHIWVATVNSRTGNKTGCPYCNSYGTSYPEQVLYHSMKQIYPKTINRGTYKGYEFDIVIPEINTCIEYSGWNWHKDKIDRDNEKCKLCEKHNMNFIQIYAHYGGVRSPNIFESNFILYKVDSAKHDEQLKNIISMILKQFNHSIDEIDFHKACADALGSIRSNVQDGVNDLKTWCLNNGTFGQQLLKEWTGQCENSNRTYFPDEISYGSNKKFRWQCSKNPSHIWNVTVDSRTSNKTGCPYCSGTTKVTNKNSLKTWCLNNGTFGQQLLKEWTGQCLGDNKQYTPDEVAKASAKKFKWQCSKDTSHTWEATVVARTSVKIGCPYCSGRKVTDKNSLKTWCLNNGSWGQQLLKEWTGICIEDNRQYSVDEVTRASNKRFKWQCSKGTSHIWDATLASRTGHKTGCPYCSGARITDKNSLKAWCLNNGDFGQQLINEWTGQCVDDNKQYTPDEVAKRSEKNFRWQCSKDTSHIWETTVACRTYKKTGCPYCSGRKATDKNSLKTWCLNNGDYGKQILKEWTGQCTDDNKQYTPDEVTRASGKKFRWQCSKEPSHIWDAVLVSRTGSKSGCPYCSGTKITDKNSLKNWCLNNGDFGKQLLKEWTGQCLDDNKQYTLDEVTKASAKRFRWQCSNDTSHIWDARVSNITSFKRGCPYCSERKIADENSLKTWCLDNGIFGKQIISEWTGQCLDDNKQYNPDEITRASHKKFKWRCSKDTSHIWGATVNARTISKSGCPYCSRRKVTNI